MFRPRIIPVLLLQGQGLVKTVRFKKNGARYIGDPINAVRIFNDLQADELVFLDIAACLESRDISLELVEQIGDEAFMPFSVGGNIRTCRQIRELLKAGAEKVVINTAAIASPDLIRAAAEQFGNQSVIIAMDVKKDIIGNYKVFSHCGKRKTGLDPVSYAKKLASLGAGEILVNAMDRDGMMKGYDLELVRSVADAVTIPVIACGGAGKLADLASVVKDGHASAAAAGSLFVFHGPRNAVLVNYPDHAALLEVFR
jgi:imidazole glycerol-phosphate synthase subunit HisF